MKTIVFIDSGLGGHKFAYMCYHVKTCAELGNKILCLIPESEKVREWINENYPELSGSINYYSFPPNLIHIEAKPGLLNSVVSKIKTWRAYNKIIKKASAKYNVPVDLVFFNWMDTFLVNYLHPLLISPFFRYKWSGIYFQPQILRFEPKLLTRRSSLSDIDIVLTSKNCVAVALHDEGIVQGHSFRLYGKKVLLFPEIADDTPPDMNNPIYLEVKERAKGRTIIGILGVEPFKGSAELMWLAKKMDPAKYFFAFTGPFEEYYLDYFFSDPLANEFSCFISAPPENVYVKLQYLKEGEEYNSVFSAFDIIYLIYKDFPNASNRLTKASHLHRLVIADEKYCVGEDVQKYNLGITVNGDDLGAIEKGIESLRERVIRKDFPLKEWEIYSNRNSVEVLKQKFGEIISLL